MPTPPDEWVYLFYGIPIVDVGGTPTNTPTFFFCGPSDGHYSIAGEKKAHVGLLNPLNVEVSVFPSLLGGGGSSSTTFGNVSIAVGDKLREALFFPPYYWRGVPFLIYRGPKGSTTIAADEFVLLFQGNVEDVTADRNGVVSLIVRDKMVLLQHRLQLNEYAGTGNGTTVEGGAHMEGVPKPICLGDVTNIAPVPVDDPLNVKNLYQIHDGPIVAVSRLYADGVQLDPCNDGNDPVTSANFATLANLMAWTPVPGEYATCLDEGVLRIGSATDDVGVITADVTGDDDPSVGHNWGATIQKLATKYAPDAGVNLDTASFTAAASITYAVGFYSGTQPVNVDEVIRWITESVCGYAVFKPDGDLTVGIISLDPASTATIYEHQLQDIQLPRPPKTVHNLRVGYLRYWTLQDDVAAGADDYFKRNAAIQYRYVTETSAGVLDFDPSAEERVSDGLLSAVSDATDIAADVFDMVSDPTRRVYTVTCRGHLLERRIGEVVTLIYDGFDLAAGKDCVVLAVAENLATELTTLTLYG